MQWMRCSIDERAGRGRAARARIKAGFSMDARTDQWEGLYRRELAREG
jgi:hypothetical protein